MPDLGAHCRKKLPSIPRTNERKEGTEAWSHYPETWRTRQCAKGFLQREREEKRFEKDTSIETFGASLSKFTRIAPRRAASNDLVCLAADLPALLQTPPEGGGPSAPETDGLLPLPEKTAAIRIAAVRNSCPPRRLHSPRLDWHSAVSQSDSPSDSLVDREANAPMPLQIELGRQSMVSFCAAGKSYRLNEFS